MENSSSQYGRVTQKDLAKLAGVSQATISLALGNDPRITEETRVKIRALAKKVGYVPDPYLSGLSAYRKRHAMASYKATLAWLTNYPLDRSWRHSVLFVEYFEGAKSRAAELGYELEEFNLNAKGMTPRRLEQVFRSRNISGLLISPQPEPNMKLDFSFENFAAVSFGYSLVEPSLSLVTQHHFRAVHRLFHHMLKLGYKRPGLAIDCSSDSRSLHLMSASFWIEQNVLPPEDRVPSLTDRVLNRETLYTWIDEYKPDVVVADWPKVHQWILERGLRVPEDIGFAMQSVVDQGHYYSGINENPRQIGASAVDFLVDQVNRGQRGVPEVPITILVEGTVAPGKTLRTISASA